MRCSGCGATSISALRVLMPSFGSVVTCPTCMTPLRNTSRLSVKCSAAMVLALVPVARLTDDAPILMTMLFAAFVAIGCYVYLRFARLEPITVELDPQSWTVRKALHQCSER